MAVQVSAPLLSRVKSWQLVALGISGWCALYSAAVLNWGACRNLVGNTQGGCFAMTMALAGLTARRHQQVGSKPADPRELASLLSTEQVNELLVRTMERREFRVEACSNLETERGFGVRAINAGRTMVFETARWREPVVDLEHTRSTEEHRITILADLAIIVGVGTPDEAARTFVKTCPVRLLLGNELQAIVEADKSAAAMPVAKESSERERGRQQTKSKTRKRQARFAAWWRKKSKR